MGEKGQWGIQFHYCHMVIPCNPFEMEMFCSLNNLKPFPPTVLTQLKKITLQGEEQVKTCINDRLIMQREFHSIRRLVKKVTRY